MCPLKLYGIIFFLCLLHSLEISHAGSGDSSVVSGIGNIFEAIGFSPSCVAGTLALCEKNNTNASSVDMKTHLNGLESAIEKLTKSKPRNCFDIYTSGDTESGIRTIYPFPCCENRPVLVLCDQVTDNGGWTVIQHREDLPVREDFFRNWVEYQLGFGKLSGEFWLGLEKIHALVSDNLMELRVDLEDFNNEKRWAKYDYFYIGNAAEKYKLDVGKYSGNAGNGFEGRHVGHKFSTKDQDNDNYKTNCATLYKGGWWYDQCHISNLNGYQYEGKHSSYADGINWHPFHGYNYSLKNTTLSIRPKFIQP